MSGNTGLIFELHRYSGDYSYAFVRWHKGACDSEFRSWLERRGHGVEEHSEDTPAGWDYIVNLHGHGAADEFHAQWSGLESDEQIAAQASREVFLANLLGKNATR